MAHTQLTQEMKRHAAAVALKVDKKYLIIFYLIFRNISIFNVCKELRTDDRKLSLLSKRENHSKSLIA